MRRFRGYIFSRPFMEERVPQHIQNLVIRDYCVRNGFQYLLSSTEYAMEGSAFILEQTLDELHTIDGIVAYSLYQLPQNRPKRLSVYDRVIAQKKSIHFAVEGLSISTYADSSRVEDLWQVRQTLPFCEPFPKRETK
jgi:sporadic carbohydrate cluster protein (TIGR04323 family)